MEVRSGRCRKTLMIGGDWSSNARRERLHVGSCLTDATPSAVPGVPSRNLPLRQARTIGANGRRGISDPVVSSEPPRPSSLKLPASAHPKATECRGGTKQAQRGTLRIPKPCDNRATRYQTAPLRLTIKLLERANVSW